MASTLLPSVLRRGQFRLGSLVGLSNASSCLSPVTTLKGNGAIFQFGASANFIHIQSADMVRVKHRSTHPRYVWAKKRRERNDQELSQDNQDFINQTIYDKYGPMHSSSNMTGMPFVSPLKEIIHERGEYAPWSIRSGVIARKIGVYPMWQKDGKRFLATLLQVADNHVIKYLPPDVVRQNYGNRFKREDVGLLLVGAESTDPQRFTKEYLGLFEQSGLPPKNKIARFMVTPNAYLSPGTPLYASHFKVGQKVEVFGKTIDWGFQGVMKRWNFHGMPATHGCTKSHRRGGNTGGGGEKGRVWPGTKLPGHMGNRWRKLRNVEIVRINTKHNVIFVRGPAVMGETGNFITICDTFVRDDKFDKSVLPFPTHYPEESDEPIPEDYLAPNIYDFGDPSIAFEENQ